MAKILIGTPCYGGMVTEGYMISIINLMSRLREMNITCAIKTIGKPPRQLAMQAICIQLMTAHM